MNPAFKLSWPSSEVTVQQQLQVQLHHLPHHVHTQKMTTTTATTIQRQLQARLLPNNFNIHYQTFTTSLHQSTFQGDIPRTTTQKRFYIQVQITLTLKPMPTTQTTTMLIPTSTYRCIFAVNSNFQTIFFKSVAQHGYGSSISESSHFKNNTPTATTTTHLRTRFQKQPLHQ